MKNIYLRDTWHVTRGLWYVACDMLHVTRDMWPMVGGEHYLKMSAPQLLRFRIDSVLKILNERMTDWIN